MVGLKRIETKGYYTHVVSGLLLEAYLSIVCGKNKGISGEKRDIIDAYTCQ